MTPPLHRWLIVGNFGAGKSRLARMLSERLSVPVISMDTLWESITSTPPKPRSAFLQKIQEAIRGESWIIEGAYGDGALTASARAQGLIWIDLSTDECFKNIESRQAQLLQQGKGLSDAEWNTLKEHTRAFEQGGSLSSRAGLRSLFDLFPGPKWQLRTRVEVESWRE